MTFSPGARLLPGVAVLCLLPVLAVGQVVINEVFYDPDGADTGLEFAELLNCGEQGVLLTGWVLETGNGANPNDWTVEWIGGDLDYLESGEVFLIGEADVVPAPHYSTPLDLQNGPDGLRLTDGSETVDVVGWGEPLFQEYYEGRPALDAPSGVSLARSPDCFDNDDNALDFVPRPPTPGTRNASLRDLSLRVRHPGRVIFDTSGPVEISCGVTNAGALPSGEDAALELLIDGGDAPVSSVSLPDSIAPRDSTETLVSWEAPTLGYHRANIRLVYPADCEPSDNTRDTSFTVGGPGGLVVINEVMHSPDDEGTEWVELACVSDDAVDVSGWALGDAAEAHSVSAGGESLAVAPGSEFLVVARDREVVEPLAPCPVVEPGDWEALSADDTVVLLDEFGTEMDAVSYERQWGGERGVSLERVRADMPAQDAGNWGASVAPDGSTPGRVNSIRLGQAPAAGQLTIAPNPFTPDGDGEADRTVVRLELPVARATTRVTVFDLDGRIRAVLADHLATASTTELLWDGAGLDGEPLPSGLYVVYLEAIDARAGVYVTAKTAVGIVR